MTGAGRKLPSMCPTNKQPVIISLVVSMSNRRDDLTVTNWPIPQRAFLEWGFEPRLATRFAILGRKFFASRRERGVFLCYCWVVVFFFFLYWERSESATCCWERCGVPVAVRVVRAQQGRCAPGHCFDRVRNFLSS
jgi:hypothetical protein